MKVISQKIGSSRERIDAEASLLPGASWRYDGKQRHLVLYSSHEVLGRSVELHLTELEALAITTKMSEAALDEAMKAASAKCAVTSKD